MNNTNDESKSINLGVINTFRRNRSQHPTRNSSNGGLIWDTTNHMNWNLGRMNFDKILGKLRKLIVHFGTWVRPIPSSNINILFNDDTGCVTISASCDL